MNRRQALALLACGVAPSRINAAQHQAHKLAADPSAYKLQFFTPAEHALIDTLAEMIVPADEHSPGAREARVPAFIDLVIANSPGATQEQWKELLSAFDGSVRRQHGRSFSELPVQTQTAILNSAAAGEQRPETDEARFFVLLKRMTLSGYYTSESGLGRELGYMGNKVLPSFPGCER